MKMGIGIAKVKWIIYREDWACKCGCGFMAVDVILLNIQIDTFEEFCGGELISGCRCLKHNRDVGSKHPNGFHTKGMAMDLKCNAGTPEQWKAFILKGPYGPYVEIAVYKTSVHVEIDYRKKVKAI